MAASRSVGTCALRTWKKKSNSSSPTIPTIVRIQTSGETVIVVPPMYGAGH